ncbi:septum formation initiator family protein [Erysipelothrix inopinata]|uniref:Septum formation initiator family protein n=1 Tax=Erysipelothrix inopinata TaxID=225084 RepID=A0A7G9S0F0_9FIRM|nr:septum formation initiator family protein [Erysipelothrix inopinata]QNN61325.1 septum formation initiator family protein [Erysipelothrix inopinata]
MTKKVTRRRVKSPIVRGASIVLGVVVLAISILMLTKSVNEVILTVKLNKQLSSVKSELDGVKEKNKNLTSEKAKLEDPVYFENYARGTYLLSMSEEQVFILPKGE